MEGPRGRQTPPSAAQSRAPRRVRAGWEGGCRALGRCGQNAGLGDSLWEAACAFPSCLSGGSYSLCSPAPNLWLIFRAAPRSPGLLVVQGEGAEDGFCTFATLVGNVSACIGGCGKCWVGGGQVLLRCGWLRRGAPGLSPLLPQRAGGMRPLSCQNPSFQALAFLFRL